MQLSSGKTIWGKPEMKPKIKLKICIDILMTAALLFLMPYELVGRAAHEWIGTEIFLLFILHHILNRKWTAHMFKGKYTKFRILQTILVAAIFISMIGSMVSGITNRNFQLKWKDYIIQSEIKLKRRQVKKWNIQN